MGYFSDSFEYHYFFDSNEMINSINQESTGGSTNIQDCFDYIESFSVADGIKSLTIMFLSDGYTSDTQNTAALQAHLDQIN